MIQVLVEWKTQALIPGQRNPVIHVSMQDNKQYLISYPKATIMAWRHYN